jgi:DNA-binding SARP family transcriptional activator/tetratricopeptide (TPR) repeat protein
MLRLQTLGRLRFEGEGTAALSSRRKELVLLAFLARRGPRPISRAEVAALLWEDRDEQRARQSLRQALLELRRLVGEGLQVGPETIALAERVVDLDATAFEREVEAGQLDAAVGRWQGDFLTGLEDVGGEELRAWLEAQREALRRRLHTAFTGLCEDARRRGAWNEGISWAERWVAALPLDEAGHVCLLRLLDLSGRAEEGLSRYTAFTSELRALELAPSPALEQMGLVLERSSASAPPPRLSSAALFTPMLIGRGPALAELLAAWRVAREGGGSVVLVEGELGIGKTRLCEEFLRRLERESNARMSSRAHGREGPGPVELGVLAQLTSGLAMAPGLAGARPAALAALGQIAPAVRTRFPSLSEDSGVDAGQAFGEAVAAAAGEGPVVLFIDDLPQADPASLRALLSLIEAPPPGLLVLATARTGDGEPQVILSHQPAVRRLKLQPLSLPEVELLVGSILELPLEDKRRLASRLHAQGGGSPFYIVEMVSALADEGMLAPTERGEWHLTTGERRLPLPTSVRDVMTRRLAPLTPAGRLVLEAAAVLGLPFDRALLTEVSGQSPVAVDAALEELLLQRLIRETGVPGCHEFAQELVRHHVERNVPVARGEQLSSRAISALEARATSDPAVAAALVHHRARASTLITATRRRRRRVLSGAFGAVLVVAALGVGLRLRSSPGPTGTAVAVLPFAVTGGPELGYLRDGIVTLLSTELNGVGSLRITDPRAVLGIAAQISRNPPDVGQGRRVAERLGAGTYVIGDIVEGGGKIRIRATAHRVGQPSQPIARGESEGTTGELFQLVDALAGQLLSGLSGGPYEQLTRVAATTTRSLPALKAYLEGERLFREGAFHPAAREFQRAVTEDTTFALAYYWLSVASWWADDSKAIDSAATRAVRFSSRLSERDRRLFQAWDAFLSGDALGAELIYRQIVGAEPENVEAWLQLGEVLFHSGPRRGYPLAGARLPFKRVLYFEPEHTSAILHLARIAASEGRAGELDSLVRRILQLNPAGEWAVEAKALRSFARGDAAEQQEVLSELRTAIEGRVWNTARYVAVGAQNLPGAEKIIALLTEPTRPPEVRAFGYIARAHLALAHGQLRASNAELQPAFLLDPVSALEQRGLLALMPFVPIAGAGLRALRDSVIRGLPSTPAAHLETSHLATLHEGVHAELQQYLAAGLSLRMGDEAMARNYLQRLERPRTSPLAASLAQDAAASIRAQMALGAGRQAEAATALEQVQRLEARVGLIGGSPFYSQGLERYLYGGIMEKQGRFEDALRWYSSFSSNSIFDFVFLAPAHVHRGRMLERLGRAREAADHYRSALELYQDSDTEFGPIVKEAREGLARLTVAAPGRRSGVPITPGISTTQREGRTIASRPDRSPARRIAR